MSKRYAVRPVKDSRPITSSDRKPFAIVDLTDDDPQTRIVERCQGKSEAQVECARMNRESGG
jgi:hypothetical protein